MSKSARTRPSKPGTSRTPARRAPAQRKPAPRRKPAPPPRSSRLWLWAAAAVLAVGIVVLLVVTRQGGESGPGLPFVGGDLHSLAMEPGPGGRIFVGGHEGVAASADEGRTWQRIDGLDGADAMGWAFVGDRILVGGHPGLHVSVDGGRTFSLENDALPATDVHALGAGAGMVYAASPQLGVFASTDSGRTWETRTTDVGQSFMGRMLVDPQDAQHIVAPDMSAGAVESRDGGRTWTQLGGVPAMWVSWLPGDVDTLIVSGQDQAARSTDGGKTWESIDVPAGVSIVEMNPSDGQRLFGAAHVGSSAEIWTSRDGGRSWKRT